MAEALLSSHREFVSLSYLPERDRFFLWQGPGAGKGGGADGGGAGRTEGGPG